MLGKKYVHMVRFCRNKLDRSWLEWSNWLVLLVLLPMSAKIGVFVAEYRIFLADKTMEYI